MKVGGGPHATDLRSRTPGRSGTAVRRLGGLRALATWRDGAALRVGPTATTRMACADPALGAQEQALLAALAATTRHAIDGDVLTLSGDDGLLARFTATVRP